MAGYKKTASQRMLGIKLNPIKQQRRAGDIVLASDHLADQNHMVALRVLASVGAFKHGSTSCEQRNAAIAVGEFQALKTMC